MLRKASLRVAIENITRWGDTDVFPKPFENHVIAAMPKEFEDLLSEIGRDFRTALATRPPTLVTAATPVGYSGFRRASQLDPVWNAFLLAAVVNLSEQIEAARITKDYVYSHRIDSKFPDGRLFEEGAYSAFLSASRTQAESHTHVVVTDIADFYSRVYHHRLENALLALPKQGGVARPIVRLLGEISGGKSYGLPVGGPAARVLAELLLDRSDHALVSERVRFLRYADDYRIFAKSEDEAHGQLATLSDLLAVNEGLSLQKSKTRVMTSAEYIATLDVPSPHSSRLSGAELKARQLLNFSLRFDPYAPDAELDYQRLESEIDKLDIVDLFSIELSKSRVDPQFTKKLLKAVQFSSPSVKGAVAESLCLNFALLAPVFPQVLGAIKGLWSDLPSGTRHVVTNALVDLWEANSYLLRPGVSRSYFVRVLAEDRGPRSQSTLLDIYSDPRSDNAVRRDVILAMANRRALWWLSGLIPKFRDMESASQRRAFLAAGPVMTEESEFFLKRVRRSLSPLELMVSDWAAACKKADESWTPPI